MLSISLLATTLLLAAPERPRIELTQANLRAFPIAVAPFADKGGAKSLAAEIQSALEFDLAASGIFQLLDPQSFLASAKEGMTVAAIDFRKWTDVGAEGLIKAAASVDGGLAKAELHLFGVVEGKEELKLSLSRPKAEARQLAHAFANELFKHYTGEPGPFQTRIAYVRKTVKGSTRSNVIVVADWDGRNQVKLSPGPLDLLPAWAPDGSTLAFTGYEASNPDLYLLPVHGGNPQPFVKRGRLCTGVAFSPNGKRVAFAMSEDDSSQLFLMSRDGTGLVKLTDTKFGALNTSPSWSPDGQQIAFVSNRAGSPQIYVMPASGGDAKRLTFQGNYNQTPDWSPRSDLIAFTGRDERNVFDVFTVEIATGKISRITQDQGNNEEPSFAPNGRLMTFSSNRQGRYQLWVSTLDGNTQKPLAADPGETATPAWGPLP